MRTFSQNTQRAKSVLSDKTVTPPPNHKKYIPCSKKKKKLRNEKTCKISFLTHNSPKYLGVKIR